MEKFSSWFYDAESMLIYYIDELIDDFEIPFSLIHYLIGNF